MTLGDAGQPHIHIRDIMEVRDAALTVTGELSRAGYR